MKLLNYSNQPIEGFISTSTADKKSLLAGSIVLIFEDEKQFKEKCHELINRISGIIFYRHYPAKITINNELLFIMPIEMITTLPEDLRMNSLYNILNNIEEKRRLSSRYQMKREEQLKTQTSLDLVTKNYYETAKTLEKNSKIQLKRRDAILAISNKVARISGFQIDIASGAITFSENFFNIFIHQGLVTFDLVTGISCFPKEANQTILTDIQSCINSGESIYREICINKETNQWYAVQLQKAENLGSATILGVLQNISLRKQLEAETEEQRKRAMNASKLAALGEMSGGIAHEINTPLSILTLQLTRLERILKQDRQLESEIQVCIQNLKATIEKIATIIRGMKILSRGEGEACELIPTSLNKILKEVISVCMPKIKMQNIKLEISDEEKIGNIEYKLPELQITQILINLIKNSKDAVTNLDEKWIQLIINKHRDSLNISVIDSGPGIAKEIQEKIFNPFFTTKEVGKGTGLGLSLSKSLAKSFNGDLFLVNNIGHTRFDLKIPLQGV